LRRRSLLIVMLSLAVVMLGLYFPLRLLLLWREREAELPSQGAGKQPNVLGTHAHPQSLLASLDRNRDFPSGRKATSWHGRLSAQERNGLDPAHVSGAPSV
jgi:hypothetical protein